MEYWGIHFVLSGFFFACGSCLLFKTGNIYQYSYSTSTLFNEVNSDSKISANLRQDVGVQLSIDFDIIPLMSDSDALFIKLQLTSAKFSSVARPAEERIPEFMLKYPAYFELAGDTIQRVYLVDADPIFSTNIKKGIIALFQLKQEPGERTEIDVSGECQVSYVVTSPNAVSKTKHTCQNLEIAGQFSTPNKMLGLSVWNKATMHYELKDGIVNRATGTTRLVSYLNLRTSLNAGILSSQKVSLENTAKQDISTSSSVEDAVKKAEAEIGRSFVLTLLPSDNEVEQCTENCKSPNQLATELHDSLVKENLATLQSAKAFVQMLRSFRNAGKTTISETFTNPDSFLLVTQLIDIAAAAQTRASQEALLELLSFEDDSALDYPERYLFAAAYTTHPSEALINDLLELLKKNLPSETLRESILLGLSSVVHTYCQVKDQCKHQLVKVVQQLLVNGLEACGEASCRGMYLRALGNAGLPETVPAILRHAETPNTPTLAYTAINALRRIHKQFIGDQVKRTMLRIFHQNEARYDSSVRAAALDVLLKNQPSPQVLRNILLSLTDQSSCEFSTYVYTSLLDAASADSAVRDNLDVLLIDPSINNYYIRAQRGKSSIFTNFLAKTEDINATYSMYIENGNSGIMKRSGMDVNLLGKILKQPFLKFGIYAEGLESLVGETGGANGDGGGDAEVVEPTAGMTFTLLDVLLRQIEFFRGSSGLMSAVWNAPSELTSALQGNLLLQDHSQRVHLGNGLIISIEVLGVLSMDLSGYVSISLWNRNCEALIKNSGALYIEGSIRLESSLLKAGIVFTGEGHSSIDFTTDAEFYEMPLKLCMQMSRPDFSFRQTVTKYESLIGVKRLHRQFRKTSKVAGESYFLNDQNSQECRLMKKEN